MSPAATTVLWDVLIQRVRQVGDSFDVRPGKGFREFVRTNVGVGKRTLDVAVDRIVTDLSCKSTRQRMSFVSIQYY